MSRRSRLLVAAALVLLVLAAALAWLAQPRQVAGILLDRAGNALGLEITAHGTTEYTLRGTPVLVLRDVQARQPDAKTPVLRARRILVSLPWSTLRAAGGDLTASRLELDAPRIDLPALQRWLDSRPPSAPRLPTFTDGIRIRAGELVGPPWRLADIDIDTPRLRADQPLQAHVRARYLDAPLTATVDLAVALSRPEILVKPGGSGFAAHGRLRVQNGQAWAMPGTLAFSGPLRRGNEDWRLRPAHVGLAARYESGDTRLPFALGLHGPLQLRDGVHLTQAGVFLRGRGDPKDDLIPLLHARGDVVLTERLTLGLAGDIAQWPPAWPALPPPLGQSDSALPFRLDYAGDFSLTDPVALRVSRDATRFDGRFKIAQMLEWADAAAAGNPLPPLAGTLSTPRIEISGAVLEGVEVEFHGEAGSP
ncbi:AsmA family protein [Agrilutibacter solisilvae]|uniref:hypothetical protein n=1 Tax=Agrilutibacter solisilvae TaxID=2763317 RepID=UPI001FD6D97E|nr:hypothetical protein [Lysobacter solisilvae]